MESKANKNSEVWIIAAYEVFARAGFKGLRIEQLAKKVKISKSSFYHHFADLEYFTELLFEYHFDRCRVLAEKEKKCQIIDPDLINVLLEHRTDLLFHRQLRVHRGNANVEKALRKSNALLGNYAAMLWAKTINLNLSQVQLEGLFELATDDFYMRLTEDNLNYEFLSSYFKNLSHITKRFA
ncbi:MAG: TetR/AcrR family transcriptional regulator [Bacteroidota bacterium]